MSRKREKRTEKLTHTGRRFCVSSVPRLLLWGTLLIGGALLGVAGCSGAASQRDPSARDAGTGAAAASAEASEAAPATALDSVRADAVPPERFHVADGLEATLWADSPMFYNPTNIDVDAKGRLWVLEAVDYRNFNNPPESHFSHPAGERIVIVEDTDGNGRADSAKTFVQDDDLVAPLGIGVIGNKVYVSASPNLFVYTDTDGDDKADKRETFLTGFGGLDHDHGLHAVTAGPGGRLLFNAGNAGPHITTDSAGWTLRAGSIYSGGTPYMDENQPGLESDDGRVWTGGINLRIRPDGTGLEVLGHNLRNSYELAVDSYGTFWNNDNDDDGNNSTRVLHAMRGANMGYFGSDGTRRWQADRRPDQDTYTAHWHQEDPGVIPAGDRTGPGAPTGIVTYEGDALGERFRGALLSADAGRNVIYGYQPEQAGAGYDLDSYSFFSALPDSVVYNRGSYDNWDPEGKRYWFRPSDVAVGPSGAVYVSDWYDARVGGHQMQDSTGYGRIYRITPEGENPQPPAMDLSTTEGQLEALKSPAPNVRPLGFRRLAEKGADAVEDVKDLLDAENPFHRARAMWLLARLGPQGIQEAERVLRSGSYDAKLRVAAFRALKQELGRAKMRLHAQAAAESNAPALRREAALFLREVPLSESREAMVALARQYDGEDRWMLEAIGLAAEGERAATYELLRQEMDGPSDPPDWSDAWSDLAWRLHPPEAAEALKARAAAPGLSWEAKKQAMTALGFISDRRAVEAMEALAESDDAQVAERAQWWLDYRRTNEWHNLKDWRAEEQNPRERQALRRAERQEEYITDADVSTAKREDTVRAMAGTRMGSRRLLRRVIDEELPGELEKAVSDTLLDSPNRTVRVLSKHYLKQRPEEKTYDAKRIAQMDADRQQGQMVFFAKCAVCHRVDDTGRNVGPELTGVKNVFNAEGLANALIRPSSGIAHGYDPWQVRTTDGEVLYGFLLAENEDTIVLKDDQGREHVINRSRVAGRKQLDGVSLMPGPAELKLTRQEIADVTAFLQTVEEGNSESEGAR